MNVSLDTTNDTVSNSAMRYSHFLNSLELWIDEMIARDNLTAIELVNIVKERFQTSMQANIDFHKSMMTCSIGNEDQKSLERHMLIAAVYQALL